GLGKPFRLAFTLVPCATSNYGRLCAHIDGLAQEMIAHGVAVPYVPYMRHREFVQTMTEDDRICVYRECIHKLDREAEKWKILFGLLAAAVALVVFFLLTD